jgi:hypothetical protein
MLPRTDCKQKGFQAECSERVRCANAFRMGSSISSFASKYCACVFLAQIILFAVDCRYFHLRVVKWWVRMDGLPFLWGNIYYLILKISRYSQLIGVWFDPLNAELNRICHLLALLGAHPKLHVSRIRVKLLLVALFRFSSHAWRSVGLFTGSNMFAISVFIYQITRRHITGDSNLKFVNDY